MQILDVTPLKSKFSELKMQVSKFVELKNLICGIRK
jgi:hypothetical protein